MADSSKTPYMKLRFDNEVAIITMCRGENTIDFEFMDQMITALDSVLKNSEVKALITTGESRFYSNGADVNPLELPPVDEIARFHRKYSQMLAKIMTFPIPTVAAINGHAVGAGALLPLAHDYIIMQTHKGWWYVNEIFLGISFAPALISFMKSKLPPGRCLQEAVILGRRFTAEEALRVGIVQDICAPNELMTRAFAWIKTNVTPVGYARHHLQKMKEDLYKDVVNGLNGITAKL